MTVSWSCRPVATETNGTGIKWPPYFVPDVLAVSSIFWDMLFIFSVTTSLGTMRLKRWSEFKS